MRALIFAALLMVLVGCSQEQPGPPPSGRTIKIGIIGPLTGPDQILGQGTLSGIEALLHLQPLLANGDRIELVLRDDHNQPMQAVQALQDLATEGEITAIFLLSSSEAALAVNQVVDTYKIPVLCGLATHQNIAVDRQYISQLCFDNWFQGKVAALYVHDELLVDRVTLIQDSASVHSSSLVEAFVKKFRAIGGEVLETIDMQAHRQDLGPALATARTKDPQLLYMPLDTSALLKVKTVLKESGWACPSMSCDGVLPQAIASSKTVQQLLEGTLVVDFFGNNINKSPRGLAALRAYRTLYPQSYSTFPGLGFEGMDILTAAMNRCDDPRDRACVNRRIRSTEHFQGIMGHLFIRQNGKAERPLIVGRIRSGRIRSVVKVY